MIRIFEKLNWKMVDYNGGEAKKNFRQVIRFWCGSC